jgi:uncharacterized coiled-coil DUF342 family protein
MPVFDNLGKKIGNIAQSAAKKSGEMVEITKMNLSINKEEDSIKKLYAEIGEYCYERVENGAQFDDEIVSLCQQINSHKNNISSLKEKINEIKN